MLEVQICPMHNPDGRGGADLLPRPLCADKAAKQPHLTVQKGLTDRSDSLTLQTERTDQADTLNARNTLPALSHHTLCNDPGKPSVHACVPVAIRQPRTVLRKTHPIHIISAIRLLCRQATITDTSMLRIKEKPPATNRGLFYLTIG